MARGKSDTPRSAAHTSIELPLHHADAMDYFKENRMKLIKMHFIQVYVFYKDFKEI
jgi:hypothetical protein